MKIKYSYFTVWAFSFFASISVLSAQNKVYVRSVIESLSSEKFHGRGYAFKGDSIAADFVSQEFMNLNLKNWTKDYLQFYTVSMNVFEGNVKVDFGKNYPSSSQSDAMQIAAYSSAIKGKFKIVSATDKMLEKKPDPSKINNKFIAVDMTQYASDEQKKKQWVQIIRNDSLGAKGYIVLNEKLNSYSAIQGCKKSPHTTIMLVKDSVSGTLKNIDIDIDSRFIDNYKTQNICGYIEGKLYPDSFFVIGAHYDHLGRMGKDYFFPGANDNASGVAMLLDLAQYFTAENNQSDYSIAFIAFSGEEIGLLGSFNFVENSLFDLNKVKIMLNLDMVGTGEDGFRFLGGEVFPEEFNKFETINNEKGYTKKMISGGISSNSDHYPFYEHGCKAMFIFGMGKSGRYHHHSDTLENLSLGGYENLFHLIVDYINLHNTK